MEKEKIVNYAGERWKPVGKDNEGGQKYELAFYRLPVPDGKPDAFVLYNTGKVVFYRENREMFEAYAGEQVLEQL